MTYIELEDMALVYLVGKGIAEPTPQEIGAEINHISYEISTSEYNKVNWSIVRERAYSLLNQDEMRYDDIVNGTNFWVEAIQAIKTAYPKPGDN